MSIKRCKVWIGVRDLETRPFDEMRMRVTRTHRVSLAFWNRLKIIRAPANNTAYYHKRCLSV